MPWLHGPGDDACLRRVELEGGHTPADAALIVALANSADALIALAVAARQYSDHIFDGGSMCCEVCLDIADATTGGRYWCRLHVPETLPDISPGWTVADLLVWRLRYLRLPTATRSGREHEPSPR